MESNYYSVWVSNNNWDISSSYKSGIYKIYKFLLFQWDNKHFFQICNSNFSTPFNKSSVICAFLFLSLVVQIFYSDFPFFYDFPITFPTEFQTMNTNRKIQRHPIMAISLFAVSSSYHCFDCRASEAIRSI